MPAGLTIYNTENTVQIDENWKNYGFRQAIPVFFSVTSTSLPAGWGGQPYQLVVSGSPQLLCACLAESLHVLKMQSFYDGTNWTFTWVICPPFPGTYSETIVFYIFDRMDSSYSNVGLEVFDAAGERVFHSDAPVMRLGSDSNPGVQGCTTTFVGDAGRLYVPLILMQPLAGQGSRIQSWPLLRSAHTIYSGPMRQYGSFGSLSTFEEPGLYAAIDVTGLS